MFGNLEMMKILIQYGENVNECDSGGQTPIFFAATSNNQEAIDYLISCGAKTDVKDKEGKTYLEIANPKMII